MNLIEKLTKIAKKYFTSAKGSHDWEHTLRVLKNCERIGKKEKADMTILRIAAILHDIGRSKEDKKKGKINHAAEGAIMASNILKKLGLAQEKIQKISHCIAAHRFRSVEIPISKEAKILYDADKLDAIGVTGIGRAFLFAGEIGANLHDKNIDIKTTQQYTKEDTAYREYLIKLRKIKDKILTAEGRRMAIGRHNFMVKFFNRLNKEVEGKL